MLEFFLSASHVIIDLILIELRCIFFLADLVDAFVLVKLFYFVYYVFCPLLLIFSFIFDLMLCFDILSLMKFQVYFLVLTLLYCLFSFNTEFLLVQKSLICVLRDITLTCILILSQMIRSLTCLKSLKKRMRQAILLIGYSIVSFMFLSLSMPFGYYLYQ